MKTYEELKNTNDLKVVDWFTPNTTEQLYLRWRENFNVERETEKAVLITVDGYKWNGDVKDVTVWVPKKCFESQSEYTAKEAKAEERYQNACNRYEELVAFCKENGVKGARVGLRKDTLLAKVAEAGLAFNW